MIEIMSNYYYESTSAKLVPRGTNLNTIIPVKCIATFKSLRMTLTH